MNNVRHMIHCGKKKKQENLKRVELNLFPQFLFDV